MRMCGVADMRILSEAQTALLVEPSLGSVVDRTALEHPQVRKYGNAESRICGDIDVVPLAKCPRSGPIRLS
jgi:hypothetical protein